MNCIVSNELCVELKGWSLNRANRWENVGMREPLKSKHTKKGCIPDDHGTVTPSAFLCNLRKHIANSKGRSTKRMMEKNTFFNVLTTIYKTVLIYFRHNKHVVRWYSPPINDGGLENAQQNFMYYIWIHVIQTLTYFFQRIFFVIVGGPPPQWCE